MTEQQKLKLLDLHQLFQTKARYYQDQANKQNSEDYLTDAKCFRTTADLLMEILKSAE